MGNKKIAIITGAGSGIGQAIAINIAKKHYNLALIDISDAGLQQTKAAVNSNNPTLTEDILTFKVDVANPTQVSDTIKKIIDDGYIIELLFNVAGIAYPHMTKASIEEFKELIAVNLFGAFYFAKAVAPHMKKLKRGYIVNLASLAAKQAHPDLGIYATSKFGLLGLNEALQRELAEYNIKVTALCPSFVDTPLSEPINFPRDEMVKIDDITKAIDFLLQLSHNANIKELVIHCNAAVKQSAASILKPDYV